MMFGIVGFLILAAFLAQIALCIRAKRRLVRLLPVVVLGLGELLCIAGFGVSVLLERSGHGVYGAAFAAVIYGYVLLIALMADGLAWVIFKTVRYIQKRRK